MPSFGRSTVFVLVQTALVTVGLYLGKVSPTYTSVENYINEGKPYPRIMQAGYFALFTIGALAIGQLLLGKWVCNSGSTKSITGIIPMPST